MRACGLKLVRLILIGLTFSTIGQCAERCGESAEKLGRIKVWSFVSSAVVTTTMSVSSAVVTTTMSLLLCYTVVHVAVVDCVCFSVIRLI